MKHLKLFIFSAFAFVSVVVIRCLQLVFLTDTKTGFWVEGMEDIGTATAVLTAVIIGFAALMVYLSKKVSIDPIPTASPFVGCAAIMAGLAHIIEPFISNAKLTSVPPFLVGLRIAFIMLAGVVFVIIGVNILLEKNPHFGLSVVLILSSVVRLMSTFVSFTGMSNISENTYDVLMLVMNLIFFYMFSKAICGLSRSNNYRKLIASGVGTVLFTAASALPNLIVSFFVKATFAHKPIDSPVTGIFISLFITVYLIDICRNKASDYA